MKIEASPGVALERRPLPGCVFVLMSGGVDSSVAALLLLREGLDVAAVTMDLPGPAVIEAARMARELAVPHYVARVGDVFRRLVVEPFVEGYLAGVTPNPCADCNALLKFGLLWDSLEDAFGEVRVATGHYARIVREGGRAFLARGADPHKDQSYFLSGLPRRRLPGVMLPLGGMSKTEVRSIAREAGLPAAERPESMEICFAGEGDYRRLVEGREQKPGLLLDESGAVLGSHRGIAGFTVGQRKGLGLASREGLYVKRIDADTGRVIVAPREGVMRRRVRAGSVNLLFPSPPEAGELLFGKTRSRGEPDPCVLVRMDGEGMEVLFHEPRFAPAPGQRLVLYASDGRVVAGGVIEYCEEVE
ncbi:MAG: tRNA 2-thiouridine(34) synthase MnmA [Synergistota bacterium]|nr:tRNA 2-thiouridine(34) synthase MnmA [Synergistota bacterium]